MSTILQTYNKLTHHITHKIVLYLPNQFVKLSDILYEYIINMNQTWIPTVISLLTVHKLQHGKSWIHIHLLCPANGFILMTTSNWCPKISHRKTWDQFWHQFLHYARRKQNWIAWHMWKGLRHTAFRYINRYYSYIEGSKL